MTKISRYQSSLDHRAKSLEVEKKNCVRAVAKFNPENEIALLITLLLTYLDFI